MISVIVKFGAAALPTVVGAPELNVTVSFPRVTIVSSAGVNYLESIGNDTNTITKTALVGKTVLQVSTDGRIRSILNSEYSFTSSTGVTVFGSPVYSDQVIRWLYK